MCIWSWFPCVLSIQIRSYFQPKTVWLPDVRHSLIIALLPLFSVNQYDQPSSSLLCESPTDCWACWSVSPCQHSLLAFSKNFTVNCFTVNLTVSCPEIFKLQVQLLISDLDYIFLGLLDKSRTLLLFPLLQLTEGWVNSPLICICMTKSAY